MLLRLSFALLALGGAATAQERAATAQERAPDPTPAPAGYSTPAFELFKMAPGKSEEFIRSVAIWDQVNEAGGQPKSHLYTHAGGEIWDVMLYKPPRPAPTAAQIAAMEAKRKELGLPTGKMYWLNIREKLAQHAYIIMNGPYLAENWIKELEQQRADFKAGRK